jgi:hypothetical protein
VAAAQAARGAHLGLAGQFGRSAAAALSWAGVSLFGLHNRRVRR